MGWDQIKGPSFPIDFHGMDLGRITDSGLSAVNETYLMVGSGGRSGRKSAGTHSRHVGGGGGGSGGGGSDRHRRLSSPTVDIETAGIVGWHVPLKFVAFVNEPAANQRPFVTAHSNDTPVVIDLISMT